jgi:hypothetical protein
VTAAVEVVVAAGDDDVVVVVGTVVVVVGTVVVVVGAGGRDVEVVPEDVDPPQAASVIVVPRRITTAIGTHPFRPAVAPPRFRDCTIPPPFRRYDVDRSPRGESRTTGDPTPRTDRLR